MIEVGKVVGIKQPVRPLSYDSEEKQRTADSLKELQGLVIELSQRLVAAEKEINRLGGAGEGA